MSQADVIRWEYEGLQQGARAFEQEADVVRRTLAELRQQVDVLRGGAWVGPAADTFTSAMDKDVLPGVQRLGDAMALAQEQTLAIIAILEQAEQDAADAINWEGGGADGGGGNGGAGMVATAAGDADRPLPPGVRAMTLMGNGGVQGYTLDLHTIRNPDQLAAALDAINPGDRPVVYVVHGIAAYDSSVNGNGYRDAAQFYQNRYDDMQPPPIVIGIGWESRDLLAYGTAEANSRRDGPLFGQLLDAHSQNYPNSSINIVAHSLGNGLSMNAISNSEAVINSYVAVQPAVNVSSVNPAPRNFWDRLWNGPEGEYSAIQDTNRVQNLTVTYNPADLALRGRTERGTLFLDPTHWGTSIGNVDPNNTFRHRPVNSVGLPLNGDLPLGHYSYNHPSVQPHLVDVFRPDGSGLRLQPNGN